MDLFPSLVLHFTRSHALDLFVHCRWGRGSRIDVGSLTIPSRTRLECRFGWGKVNVVMINVRL